MKIFIFICSLVVVMAVSGTLAQVPQTVSYQGVLKDDTGAIVPDGDYEFTFKLYNVDTGGSPLWTEDQTKHVTAGILSVILGEVTPITLPFDEQYWLGVTIGAGTELEPRTKLTGTPYSLNAQAVRGDNIFPQSGDVGIGTDGPAYPFHVVANNIRPLRLDGTAFGSWSLLSLNAAGANSNPGIEYLKTGSLKATTYVGFSDNWHLRVGAADVITAEAGTYNVGIDRTNPEEKLDVSGAIRIGTTANNNAGTIRWSGADFEGYDGSVWHSLTSNGGAGSLPAGSLGQTLRHTGISWIATSALYNDGNSIGVGHTTPVEKLDVYGAIRLGTTANTNAGTIRWSGSDFEGYDGSTWHSLTSNGGSGSLPSGSAGQTLRHTGSGWVATSNLHNDGASIGIGTIGPARDLHIRRDEDETVGIIIENLSTGSSSSERIDFKDEHGSVAGLVVFDDTYSPYPSEMHLFNNRPGGLLGLNAGSGSVYINNDGNVGVGLKVPDATLHVLGGNWDLNGTEGDFKIGDSTHRLKVGVATDGGGAGTAGIRVQGGQERLVLGAGTAEALWIKNDGEVDIGSSSQTGVLNVYRSGVPNEVARLGTGTHGGNLYIRDESFNITGSLVSDGDGEGGVLSVYRNEDYTGLYVDGNWLGGGDPLVAITGANRGVYFELDIEGDYCVQLPQDAVNSREMHNEAGTASAIDGTGSFILGPTPQSMISRSIVVPDSGYVLVIATCEAYAVHTNGTHSAAEFGVSSSTAFPSNQDFLWNVPDAANSGFYYSPITVHGLFNVASAGTYTYHLLGVEHWGNIAVYDRQLTLVYIPTSYGTVSPTAASGGGGRGDEGPVVTSYSTAETAAERAASEAANRARIDRELREMRERLMAVERELEQQRKGEGR
jgi:hypothetical protein